MILLAGVTSFLVGNAYHPQMPAFAADLGHGENGVAYSALLAADAFGAILAGFALEYWRVLDASPRTAIALATLWALALLGFALAPLYPLALILLVAAGFFELAFNTMAQTLVQLNAPTEIRGRVIGLFNMASLGMRAFSGITVGVVAVWTGIHVSLGLSAALVAIAMVVLFRLVRQ
jgi:MFS family permease